MSYISAIRQNDTVYVWERTEYGRSLKKFDAPYYFYVKSSEGSYTSLYGDKLTRFDFDTSTEFYHAKQHCDSHNIEKFESDIPPELKILSQHYYGKKAPNLNVTLLDIEVDYDKEIGFSSVKNPYAPINSVALYHQHTDKYIVFAVPPTDATCEIPCIGQAPSDYINKLDQISPLNNINLEVFFCRDERELLLRLLVEIEDSDLVCGWNSDFFDVPYIGKRLEIMGQNFFKRLSFDGAKKPRWREIEKFKTVQYMLDLSGRISIDYLELFKKYEMAERPSYKLESIAEEILPDLPKLEYEGSLADLYRKDFNYFIRYNIRDTEILQGFENVLGYIALANEMVHLSTGDFKHVGGTLKLAELATINYCHHVLGGIIVNDVHVSEDGGAIQGAMVLNPKVGMHEWIGSVDISSLYPSAIRSINISPETLRGQFTDCIRASDEIEKNSEKELVFEEENTGKIISKTAKEWRELFIERKWAVSGFGTVFDQNKQGIIPKILEDWYAQRKVYKKKMEQAKSANDEISADYYDRLQYVYKIKLNSFYGALTNRFFRFYDLRMGESTTGTGRKILKHQCAKANEILKGKYDMSGDAVVYGDSVAGDTLIETPNGPVKIETLFKKTDYTIQNKEYCNTTDLALTFDKNINDNSFKSIKYIVRHKVDKKMYRVWVGNTNYVDVTEDHALIGYANTKHKTPGFVEIKPTEIGFNNVNALILNSHIPHNSNVVHEISNEMCEFIGFLIGDGHVEIKKESGVGVSLGNQDKQEIITKLIDPLIKQGWFTSYIEMKNGHDIRLCGVKGWKFLRTHLYYSGTKQFPTWVENLPREQMCHILKGYFSADGFANKNKTVGLCSINKDFIRITQRLLLKCGIPSNFWIERTENSYKGKFSKTHTIRLTVYNAVKFGKDVGFIQDRKNKNIRTGFSKSTQHQSQQDGYTLIHPTKIEEIKYNGYVYDIEVDDTHMFYANNILVHNTDSVYFKTFAKDADTASEIAEGVGDIINDSYDEYMQETFLVTPDFNGIVACACEVVSDKGIFVDKKRYILHLVRNDGFEVDKLKVMGLDTKKTTLPKQISKELNHFIERLLKGEDWDKIAQDIVDYKDNLNQTTDIMTIGLPKGIKGIEDYTQQLKTFGDGVRLPGHVAAGIFYNQCREKYNDKISPPIVSGMKIKVFYLTEKYGRFKSIAIPVDIETIPSWFIENFSIHREMHIERLVDKPLLNIIKAINKEVPTRQNMLVSSLLEF